MARVLPLCATAGVDGKLIIWDTPTMSVRATCEHPEVRLVQVRQLCTWQPTFFR